MDIVQILIMLAIGAVAGWLAGNIMRGGGFGLIGNIVVGIIGSVVGKFIGEILGANGGNVLTIPGPAIVGTLIWATIGAVVLLFIIGLIKKVL
ncbi:MAG: Unknown protein [uncultured Thiotrichaceae bacterium]|uniref:GlsB/YeaQ/YmgE family stress response membrane protein n=1 Tax=uncultured Thiotrichaceae bacterium TaxID=298394 RepID=A0A6S6TT79_9GAMM|nr:MAG: Unknown protein [uncultured Thiotrichaceae bacterium]